MKKVDIKYLNSFKMKKTLFIVLLLCVFSTYTYADAPNCLENGDDDYCGYTGKVQSIYVNSGNLVLMYFDTPMDPENAKLAGMQITVPNAGAVSIDQNPEFAKLFYSTALSAQATKRNVSVQMRGQIGGFPKIDRIWLAE